MQQLIQRLVRDESGASAPMGIVLVTTIVSLGAIVGLTTLRDHIVQQFGDAAVALRELRQSYRYSVAIDGNMDGDFGDPEDCVFSGGFSDVVDLVDVAGAPPACLDLTISPVDEGS